MSSVITVENLSKKYIIGHQKQGHTNLRDVLTEGAKRYANKLIHPFAAPQNDPKRWEVYGGPLACKMGVKRPVKQR